MKKFGLFLLLSLPFVGILVAGIANQLGPDPGEKFISFFAHLGIILLLITVSLRVIARVAFWSGVKRYSRMLGLFSFFYVSLHFLSYLAFETGFNFARFQEDLLERPYAYLGMMAFSILVLLALTSFRWAQIKLGRRWKQLHMMVFPAVGFAIIHIIWVARSDLIWAVLYGTIFGLIVFCRFFVQPEKLSKKS